MASASNRVLKETRSPATIAEHIGMSLFYRMCNNNDAFPNLVTEVDSDSSRRRQDTIQSRFLSVSDVRNMTFQAIWESEARKRGAQVPWMESVVEKRVLEAYHQIEGRMTDTDKKKFNRRDKQEEMLLKSGSKSREDDFRRHCLCSWSLNVLTLKTTYRHTSTQPASSMTVTFPGVKHHRQNSTTDRDL